MNTKLYTIKLTCADCARSMIATLAGHFGKEIRVGCRWCREYIEMKCPLHGWVLYQNQQKGIKVEIEPIGVNTIKP